MNTPTQPEVHGHRGARGLMPENTIPGFKLASRQGISWLEMDVVISKDGKVVVSHEPWMNHHITLTKDGERITEEQGKALNLYEMPYKVINDYDVGSLVNPNFPNQKLKKAPKPKLSKVVEEVEEHVVLYGLHMVGYNVEIKSRPEWYGVYQPEPEEYVNIFMDVIDDLNIDERLIVQSFDPEILRQMRKRDSSIELALLIDEEYNLHQNLETLGFTPQHYSPHFKLVDQALVNSCRDLGMEIHVWTVNEVADMRAMIDLKVDGIITDYPDRLVEILD